MIEKEKINDMFSSMGGIKNIELHHLENIKVENYARVIFE